MGALTLKSFPFELRGWEIEKFESIDPTDGFGSNTRVYINKDQIVLIEPDYNVNTFNTWLTDKGRQFFDGIFGTWKPNKTHKSLLKLERESWTNILKTIMQTIYIFDHCNAQKSIKHFFTIIFENLSIEILSLLIIISQNYSFIKVRRAEQIKLNNDLESHFQLNLASDKIKINSSNLCLLLATNTRYEGSYLNLTLRQRFFKGNFKCLAIGPITDLTFPISFLGSNFNTFKTIVEGNHLACNDIKLSKNPILIYNSELFKRADGTNILKMLDVLQYSNIFNKSWNGLNMLTPSLSETGTHQIANFLPITEKDLTNFSSLYFLNISPNNIANFKRITETKLLNYFLNSKNIAISNKVFLNQNSNFNNDNILVSDINKLFLNTQNINNYFYLPNSMFYENEETFINTEGLIKRTTKLISKKNNKNNWQILRKFLKKFKSNLQLLDRKNNQVIYFNSKKISNFKNYIHFQYIAIQSFTNLNFYLSIKTKPFLIAPKNNFKSKTNKLINTKLKYWLDDFFNGSKDEYSQNSLILTNCSKIIRTESTNFF
jgi:NADH dehydrogenase/NADH:ubiquinone oxidoreductase subunit G